MVEVMTTKTNPSGRSYFMKTKKVVLAPGTKIKKYQKEVQLIITILGHPEALVTDESYISDFPNQEIWRLAQRVRNLSKKGVL
jgi:ABC-type uncharacterized transport system ATPase subunit